MLQLKTSILTSFILEKILNKNRPTQTVDIYKIITALCRGKIGVGGWEAIVN